ncbi:MAG: DUF2155 domain-containing protein [Hyphomicrobiales bacterium]|nr:DUF2155 domain-containing protein [Hyphomicrobiales bacterium]
MRCLSMSALALGVVTAASMPAMADRIRNPVAVFAGLDKITGRIIAFEVNIDETVQFGSLQITPKVCWTRPATEQPQTTSFIEVDEVGLNNDYRRIFSGWMFAASPGLHGVEHAIYDVWMTDCKGGTELIVEPREPAPADAPAADLRRERAQPGQRQQPRPAAQPPLDGRIDVRPPQGLPVPPQQPTQRFFPTNPGQQNSLPRVNERNNN